MGVQRFALGCVVVVGLCGAGCSGDGGPINELFGPMALPTPGQTAREAFNTYDPDIRRRSVTRLAAAPFGGQAPYLRLYRLLVDDPDATVRAACVKAIGMHGSVDDVKLIIAQLEDDDAFVRWESAKALERIHDPQAAGPLIQVLGEDPDADVRMAAAHALGQYAQTRVYHALIGVLEDSSFGVAQAARQSLHTLTGYDFGTEGGLWLMWAQQQGDKLFDQRQSYTWQPYVRPRGLVDKIMFWRSQDGHGPRVPKGMAAPRQDGADPTL